MLVEVDPNRRLEKDEYKNTLRPLEEKLSVLQHRIRDANLPVVIVFEGWSAAGKGTHISRLVNPLDPRYFDVRTTDKITEEKIMRPFLWSYWTCLPPRGQIAILEKGWHRLILPEHREKWELSNMAANGFFFDVNAFERQLSDDGCLLIKLFLHISKEEQSRRLKDFAKDPSTTWRVTEEDLTQNKNYDENLRLFEKMLKQTHTDETPWHVIEANDKRFGTCKMLRIITDAIERALNKKNPAPEIIIESKIPQTLQSISPDEKISNAEYEEALEHYQQRMRTLSNNMYQKRRSAVIVFEGWDAAGKGGNIKRLTSEMDPRCYAVVPVGPPRPYELTRQFLWRFMVKMPKDGHFTLYDRSWYGRVLVERVEELTPPHIWKRAYREINEMEQHLVAHGTVLLKFWLHIDKEEQLRRFENRQSDPLKKHKITEDDWRNRDKWDLYEAAVDEMLLRTHTPHSPWIIVESNNKKFARVKVLKTVVDALEDAL
jgi:polyphosphate:AMP phosphotransferase